MAAELNPKRKRKGPLRIAKSSVRENEPGKQRRPLAGPREQRKAMKVERVRQRY
jgi:hypothetical protein